MGTRASLADQFEHIVDLCAELEHTTVDIRVKRRIANAYKRSVDKGLTLTWKEHATYNPDVIDFFLMRHAERGARDAL